MFSNAVAWYTAHAGQIFAVLIVSLVVLEFVSRRFRGELTADEQRSAITSITSGLAFIAAKSVVGKLAVTTLMLYAFDNWRFATLDLNEPTVWVAVFVLRDFLYYWVHRAEHRVRLLWASHMVHHSPETIGFTTAVRVPWMEALYKPWLGIWVPLIGFHPLAAIALDVAAATFAQLYHTERVRRLPIIDRLFVTPSAHRVHHGSNPEYIDKNYGAVFIVWDKMFGTFEPERAEVVYGIGRKRIDSPVGALVGGYPMLFDEAKRVGRWSQRVRYVTAPPA
ncbi:MAG TPA: sterol desaturase family protein [Ilumatobacter sp.]|nr:sterol desaturase family protein [Ilumatobacter sp.]